MDAISFASYRLQHYRSPARLNRNINVQAHPAHAKQYTSNRKPENGKMSRHYHFESLLSVTGANADKRVPIKTIEQTQYILKLYDEILKIAIKNPATNPCEKAQTAINKV